MLAFDVDLIIFNVSLFSDIIWVLVNLVRLKQTNKIFSVRILFYFSNCSTILNLILICTCFYSNAVWKNVFLNQLLF